MSHKVLIIEDNPDDAFIFGRLLKIEGHSFEIATNGPEGLRRALSGEFDVVLTDLNLGGASRDEGRDLVAQLHAAKPHLPVILMTGDHRAKTGDLRAKTGRDMAQVELTTHHGAGVHRSLYRGPVSGATCECTDAGCKTHRDVSECSQPVYETLYRCDMEDKTGVAFCGDCASDAIESGVFATKEA